MGLLELQMAEGWSEVATCLIAPDLLVEEGGRLYRINSRFEMLFDFGQVGPVNCPIAYDRDQQQAYRYVSAPGNGRDFSQIRAYDLNRGSSVIAVSLPLNQWVLWCLQWIAQRDGRAGRLFGLIASDRTTDSVLLEHHLFMLNPIDGVVAKRPLCRDAFAPLAFDVTRRLMVFAGAEALSVIKLTGERYARLELPEKAVGRGACFAPDGSSRVMIGGSGLRLWDYESDHCESLTKLGQYPLWSPDGKGIWYSESSADLLFYDFESRSAYPIIQVLKNHNKEFSMSRPLQLSPCQRFLAIQLSGRRMKGMKQSLVDSNKKEPVYLKAHEFCILDLKTKQLWRTSKFVNQCCWL